MANCSVCLENFNKPTTCVPCGHMFCFQCITDWCQKYSTSGICPQCRASIRHLQRVYIGDASTLEVDESKGNYVVNISANKLQWFREQYDSCKFHFKRFREWRRRLNEVHIEDEDDNDDSHTTVIDNVQHQTERLKNGWKELQLSQKLMLSFGALLVISFLIQDARSSNGFLHGLILPVLNLVVDFIWSITRSLVFVFVRPLWCIWNIFTELFMTVFDIVYTILFAVASTIWTIILIPFAIICAIFGWIFLVFTYICSAVISILRLILVMCLLAFAYLIVLDFEKREQALRLVFGAYEAMPTQSEVRCYVNYFRTYCWTFIHCLGRKVQEQSASLS